MFFISLEECLMIIFFCLLVNKDFGTGTNWHQDTSASVWDISVPRQIGTFLIMSVPEKIQIMRTTLLHCIQLSSDIVKLKEVFTCSESGPDQVISNPSWKLSRPQLKEIDFKMN
jgi:hypothetical protein